MTLKILAIDDSRTIREMLRHALGNAGFEVHLADDGVAGIEALDHCHPDLVITDINMPRLDGFGVLESNASCSDFNNGKRPRLEKQGARSWGNWLDRKAL